MIVDVDGGEHVGEVVLLALLEVGEDQPPQPCDMPGRGGFQRFPAQVGQHGIGGTAVGVGPDALDEAPLGHPLQVKRQPAALPSGDRCQAGQSGTVCRSFRATRSRNPRQP
jgi:hypothetical protein